MAEQGRHGVNAGYAKFETFPVWNLPLKHPVNIAYEAATADLDDNNIIDPFHLETYNQVTINYNRDVETFPVLKAMSRWAVVRGHFGTVPTGRTKAQRFVALRYSQVEAF